MKNQTKQSIRTAAMFFALSSFTQVSFAQHENDKSDIHLHENPLLGNCDFDISPELTQSEWKRTTREVGNIIYLNPLTSSKPLGVLNWDLQVDVTTSQFDEHSGAWNNVFSHPDSTHYLSTTNRVSVPGLRFKMGITKNIDAGIYYAPSQFSGANYGFLGFETKYSFVNDTVNDWAASVRGSYVLDANINDFNISVVGLDFTASKTFFNVLTPYAGFAMNWNHTKEMTPEVDLYNENYFGIRGIVGAEFKWKFINLGYELLFGDGFNNRAIKVGVRF